MEVDWLPRISAMSTEHPADDGGTGMYRCVLVDDQPDAITKYYHSKRPEYANETYNNILGEDQGKYYLRYGAYQDFRWNCKQAGKD